MREFFLDSNGKASMSNLLVCGSFIVSSAVIIMMAYNKMTIDATIFAAYLCPFTANSIGKAFVGKSDVGQP